MVNYMDTDMAIILHYIHKNNSTKSNVSMYVIGLAIIIVILCVVTAKGKK